MIDDATLPLAVDVGDTSIDAGTLIPDMPTTDADRRPFDAALRADFAVADAGPPPLYFNPADIVSPCDPVDPPDVIAPEKAAEFELVAVSRGITEFPPTDMNGDGVFDVFASVDWIPNGYAPIVGLSFVGGVSDQVWSPTQFLPQSVGDMDGDGVPEVVGTLWVPVGLQPDGSFDTALQQAFQVRRLDAGNDLEAATVVATVSMWGGSVPPYNWFFPSQAWLRDADGDGRDELFTALPAEVWRLVDGGLVRTAVDFDPAEADFLLDALLGTQIVDDFDGDGRVDAVSAELLPPPYFFPIGGSPVATRVVELGDDGQYHLRFHEVIPSLNLNYVAAGDFQGHGRRDFVRGGDTNGSCHFFAAYRATADDTYERYWQRALFAPGDIFGGNADSGDTDGDGRDELLINDGRMLWLYEGDGEEGFQLVYTLVYEDCGAGCMAYTALKDVTGDGRADIVVSRNPNRPGIADDGIQVYSRVAP